jgi:hypothetical protein
MRTHYLNNNISREDVPGLDAPNNPVFEDVDLDDIDDEQKLFGNDDSDSNSESDDGCD